MRPLILSLLLACAAVAAPPKAVPLDVSGDTVLVVRSFPFTVTAPAGGINYDWRYPSAFDAEESGNTLKVLSGPKGVHTVRVKVMFRTGKPIPDDFSFDGGSTKVQIGAEPKPDPVPPDPNPGPKPDPLPALKQLWLVAVEETEQAAETRGSLFRDKALIDRFKAKGHKFRVVDQDVKTADGKTPADVAPWVERAKKAGLPRLFLVDQDGNVLHEGPVPATAKEILDAVTKAGG